MTNLARALTAWCSVALLGVVPTTASAQARTGVVTGSVYDSLSHHTLAGAIVDLAPAAPGTGTSASTTSDSLGRFEIDSVLPGAYVVGFFHPSLDSLGIDAPATPVTVTAGNRAEVSVALPSARRIRGAICKSAAGARADSSGMLVGHVNDATNGIAVDGATVTAQWSEFGFSNGKLARSIPTLRVTTSSSGWFAFCSLPSTVTITMQVAHGADSSGLVGVDVRPADVTVRTFYLAKPSVIAIASTDSATLPDSLRAPPTLVYRGTGRLTGVVRAAANGPPVPGVELTVEGTGLTTSSNDHGEFSLSQLPLGTQMLLGRKVGFAPSEMAVDLLGDAPAHAEFILPTMESVMDTVKVLATKVYNADDNGFLHRKQGGVGYFFDADQVARIQPFETSDLLQRVPSVRVQESGIDRAILMRSVTNGYCQPNIFIDGAKIEDATASDLDMWVQPGAVAGLEVYTSPGDTPPEFSSGLASCGAIVVWTQVPQARRRP